MELLDLEAFFFEEENHIWEAALSFKAVDKVIQVLQVGDDGFFKNLRFSDWMEIDFFVDFGDGLNCISFEFCKSLLNDFDGKCLCV